MNVSKIWESKFKKNVTHQQKVDKFIRKQIKRFLKHLDKGSKILDIGCGIGEKTNFMKTKGFTNLYGIDISKTAIDYAKRNFTDIDFHKRSALTTKFKKESFDGIFSLAVFHCFLKEDRNKYVKEINRILKKDGILFHLVLSEEGDLMHTKKKPEKNTYVQKNGTPFHLFTRDELLDYFPNFEIIRYYHKKKKIKDKYSAVHVVIMRKK